MECNGNTSEDLNYLSDQKCDVRVGCNGLQRAGSEGFVEINLLKNCDVGLGRNSMKREDF